MAEHFEDEKLNMEAAIMEAAEKMKLLDNDPAALPLVKVMALKELETLVAKGLIMLSTYEPDADDSLREGVGMSAEYVFALRDELKAQYADDAQVMSALLGPPGGGVQ